MKLLVVYPQPVEELDIIKNSALAANAEKKTLSPVMSADKLVFLRKTADSIHVDEEIAKYIVSIVTATRPASKRPKSAEIAKTAADNVYRYVSFGASPRASIALFRVSRIFAMFSGRNYVSPEDIKLCAYPVLRHRVVLSYEAEAEGMDADAVIARILSHVPVP